jgi:chromosome segregation ATPase
VDGLRARARDLETMLATSRNEVSARSRALRALEQTHREKSTEASDLTRRLEQTQTEAATLVTERASDAERHEATVQALAAAEEQVSALSLAEARAATALSAQTKRVQELEERLIKQRAGAKLTAHDLARSIERLTAEKGLAEGALEQVRSERARLQAELHRNIPASGAKSVRIRPNGRNDNGSSLETEVAGTSGHAAITTPEPEHPTRTNPKVALV